MKNAMKKLFSLLLVAVLLVGVMPFQAFADTTDVWIELEPGTYTVNDEFIQTYYTGSGTPTKYFVHNYAYQGDSFTLSEKTAVMLAIEEFAPVHEHSYSSEVTTPPTCTAEGVTTFTCSCGDTYTEPVAVADHSYTDATCTTPKTCSVCGNTVGEVLPHNVVGGKCSYGCGYEESTSEQEPVPAAITWQIKNVEGGPVVDDGSFTPNGEIAVAKDILYYHVFNKTTAWKEQYTVDKVYSSKAGKDVGYNGEIPAGDTVTFVLTPVDDSDDSDSNGGSSSTIPSGSETLKVYARIWVHETLFDTVELTRIKGLSEDALIYQVISANTAYLQDCVDGLNDEYPNGFKAIHWNEDVLYKDDGKFHAVTMGMDIDDENEVYVNLYSAEQLIVVNVHTSKSFSYDLSVRVEGFRPGETVTDDDVLKAVKKYYNVSSMKIFTYEEMCEYLAGEDAKELSNFIAGENEDPYEVFITGSRKSGSYTYTADSSNPKTGDAIFAPAIIMGASFTCLAVLFFLNKKRAY